MIIIKYYYIKSILKCHQRLNKYIEVWRHKFRPVSYTLLLIILLKISIGRALPRSPPKMKSGIKKILLNDDALNRAFDECNNNGDEH